MPEPSTPKNGDVIVRQAELEGTSIYILSVVPGPGQYFLRTREQAVAQALAFATLTSARAWVVEGDAGLALLANPDRSRGKRSGASILVDPTMGGAMA
jgi:hypothetical protein